MKIIALDPSLRAFGWAVVEEKNNTTTLIDCGCIITESKKDSIQTNSDTVRLDEIATSLRSTIEIHKPSQLIFENPVGSKSSRANQSLSFVKGLVISAAIFSKIPYAAIKAKSVKENLTRNPDADKDTILMMVRTTYSNFDTITKGWSKVKIYAASDAVAVYMGNQLQ